MVPFSKRLYRNRRPVLLLIDDEPAFYRLLHFAFERAGYDVQLVHRPNGTQGLEYLRRPLASQDQPQPDLVLLDLNMADLDGHSVLAAIRADPDLRPLPVVVMSTSCRPQDVQKAYVLGANSYICKSMDFTDLVHMVTASIPTGSRRWNCPWRRFVRYPVVPPVKMPAPVQM